MNFSRCKWIWAGALCLALTAAGAALGSPCDGHYCNPDVAYCSTIDEFVEDTCCVDLDYDEVYHCATCARQTHLCVVAGIPYLVPGPAFGCYGSGEQCQ